MIDHEKIDVGKSENNRRKVDEKGSIDRVTIKKDLIAQQQDPKKQ